ncbi:MAG: endonuclease NucS [Clostridia bacterium]|nr:endonuclease NucS [Clostridia bacterium]
MAEKQELGFKDRNNILKTFTATGKFGWMQLYVAEDKISAKKFIRLKKYMNWFSVKNESQLKAIQELILKGAIELEWNVEPNFNISISEEQNEQANKDSKRTTVCKTVDLEIPDEIIDFFEDNPVLVEKFISLKLQGYNFDYILQLIKIVDKAILNSSERIRVAFKEVIEKIANEDAKSMQELSDLMEKYNLLQITSVTNLVKYRLDTISNLEVMIQDEKTYEINTDKSIHRLLEKNMWLIDEQYWIAQSNQTLRTFIGDEIERKHKKYKLKRPDFACVDFENKLIILELKRPKVELKKDELDQAELYLRIIKYYKSESYKPISVILIGNKISSEARDILENRRNVEIKTYQEFLAKTKKRYTKYLEATKN